MACLQVEVGGAESGGWTDRTTRRVERVDRWICKNGEWGCRVVWQGNKQEAGKNNKPKSKSSKVKSGSMTLDIPTQVSMLLIMPIKMACKVTLAALCWMWVSYLWKSIYTTRKKNYKEKFVMMKKDKNEKSDLSVLISEWFILSWFLSSWWSLRLEPHCPCLSNYKLNQMFYF